MTHVLVTGGAGFVGSTLVDRLLARGDAVTVIDDLSTGRLHHLADARKQDDAPFAFARLDVTSDALERAVAKAAPDVIIHLAAQTDPHRAAEQPVRSAVVDVVGTVNVVEAAVRCEVGKVVLGCAATGLYGDPEPWDLPVDEDHPGGPRSRAGASALSAEAHLRLAARQGLRWTSVALGSVYGPRQDPADEGGVVSVLAGRLLDGRGVTIYGDGEQTRDLVYVTDAADALALAADPSRGDGQRVNIGSGVATSINTLHAALAELTGRDVPPSYGPARPGELRHLALDRARSEVELGWVPRTPLRDGLAATVAWLGG